MRIVHKTLNTHKTYLTMRISDRTVSCNVILLGLLLSLVFGQGTVQDIDICSEADKFRCEDGELISLEKVSCGRGISCTPKTNKILFDLCHRHQSCSTLNVGAMFSSKCRSEVGDTGSIRVTFTCISGSSNFCRTNICDDSSEGLICPEGSLVHIRGMRCSSVTGKCSRSVYSSMFLCEGVRRCAASGMRTLLSQHCQHEVQKKRNIIVYYFCVPETVVENRCFSTKPQVMDTDFGIIRSPMFDSNSRHTRNECSWIINPPIKGSVRVTVHLVNSKITGTLCGPGVLNVTFVDCSSDSSVILTTRSFCLVDNSSVEIISCGQVIISSVVPQGAEFTDTFVVSYDKQYYLTAQREPPGISNCLAPPVISTSATLLQPQISSDIIDTATGISVHSYSKTSTSGTWNYISGDDVTAADKREESNIVSKRLKLIILYIFFGVVILVLTLALIAVLISYYRLSKVKNHRVNSSEKTALCQHHEDTPLDTFQNHTLAESCSTLTSETTYAFKADHDTDKVMASVHTDAISEQEEFDHRLSSGSRLSTFLSGKRDTDFRDLINTFQTGTFAVYSSLENNNSSDHMNTGDGGYYEISDTGHYDLPSDRDCSGIYEAIDPERSRSNGHDNSHIDFFSHDDYPLRNHEDKYNMVANHDQQPLFDVQHSPSSDLHYHVNNDEYAIVRKPMKQPKTVISDEYQYSPHESCSDNDVSVDFCPTSGPYDRKRQSAADSNTRWSKEKRERWGDEF